MNNLSASDPIADPDRLARRLMLQAHLSDGLPELLIGLTLLVASGSCWAHAGLVAGKLAARALILSSSLVPPVLCLGGIYAIKQIRNRWLLGRFGYVVEARQKLDLKRLAAAAGGVVVVALVATGLLYPLHLSERIPVLLLGFTMGIFTAALGRRARFLAFGLFSMAAAPVLAALPISSDLAMAWLLTVDGAFLLVSGAIVLALFLLRPVEEGD